MPIKVLQFKNDPSVYSCDNLDGMLPTDEVALTWVDIESFEPEPLLQLAKIFNIHELSIEDCLTPEHFPKIEDYGTHIFLILRSLRPKSELEHIYSEITKPSPNNSFSYQEKELNYTVKVAIYYGKNFIVTFRRFEVSWLDALIRTAEQSANNILKIKSTGLVHKIIDVLTDRFLRGISFFDKIIEDFEKQVLTNLDNFDLNDLLSLKQDLSQIRQIMRLQRGIISKLATEPSLIPDKTRRRYFKDIDDHAITIIRDLHEYAEDIASLKDSYFSMINVRLGDTMRILTVITTIGLPMEIIVGAYGMNFDFIPLLHNPVGFWIVTAAMIAISIIMLLYFRHKKWI